MLDGVRCSAGITPSRSSRASIARSVRPAKLAEHQRCVGLDALLVLHCVDGGVETLRAWSCCMNRRFFRGRIAARTFSLTPRHKLQTKTNSVKRNVRQLHTSSRVHAAVPDHPIAVVSGSRCRYQRRALNAPLGDVLVSARRNEAAPRSNVTTAPPRSSDRLNGCVARRSHKSELPVGQRPCDLASRAIALRRASWRSV